MGDKTPEVVEDDVPIFEVTMAPGFATGLVMHAPGEQIRWEVPEGWNEKKNGKHYASHGPSVTFKCCNKAAEKLMADHKAKVAEKNKPRPTAQDEAAKAMQEQNLKLMSMFAEAQAEQRRTNERLADAIEAMSKKK